MLKKYLISLLLIPVFFTWLAIIFYANRNEQPTISEDVATSSAQVATPSAEISYQTAIVSWYGKEVCQTSVYMGSGKEACRTANGTIFNEDSDTFAHTSLPFGTGVEFCYNDTCVIGICDDRGPYYLNREFDLTRGLFSQLADLNKGVLEVEWREVNLK